MKEDNTETWMSEAGQRGQKQWAPEPSTGRGSHAAAGQPGSRAAWQVLVRNEPVPQPASQQAGPALESWLVPSVNKPWPHPGAQKLSLCTQPLHEARQPRAL